MLKGRKLIKKIKFTKWLSVTKDVFVFLASKQELKFRFFDFFTPEMSSSPILTGWAWIVDPLRCCYFHSSLMSRRARIAIFLMLFFRFPLNQSSKWRMIAELNSGATTSAVHEYSRINVYLVTWSIQHYSLVVRCRRQWTNWSHDSTLHKANWKFQNNVFDEMTRNPQETSTDSRPASSHPKRMSGSQLNYPQLRPQSEMEWKDCLLLNIWGIISLTTLSLLISL